MPGLSCKIEASGFFSFVPRIRNRRFNKTLRGFSCFSFSALCEFNLMVYANFWPRLEINSILSFYSCVFLSNFRSLSLTLSHFYHVGDCTARIIKLAENVRGGWRGILPEGPYVTRVRTLRRFIPSLFPRKLFRPLARAVNLLFFLDVNSFAYR